jgi:EmrB/QacA subfamily drug resistance transporter
MSRNNEAAPPMNAGRIYSQAERLRVLVGIIMCILLAALDQTVVLPAIPQMAATLHGAGHLSWVVSAYLLTTTATTPIYGKLSDQLGRRIVLVPALILFLLSCVLCALSTSILMLIVARALQGVGGGALQAVSQAAVGDVIPPRERGKYQAWFAGTWAFASIAGPIAGGLITQHFSWRWIFWGNLPLGFIAMVLCVRGLAGLAPAGLRTKIDYTGALLMIVSVAAVLLGLSMGGVDFPWASASEAGILAAGIAAFAVLFYQQKRTAEPLFPGTLMGRAAYRQILEISFLNSAVLFGAIFLLPLMMQWLYRQSPASSGLNIVPFLASSTIGSFIAGRATRLSGRFRPVMVAGVVMATGGFLLLGLAPEAGWLAYPLCVSAIFGLGIGLVLPSSLVAAQSQAGPRDMGVATGTLLLTRAMGGAFGATMVDALLAIAHQNLAYGFRLGFLACAVLEGVAVAVALRMEDIQLRQTLEVAPAAEAH